MAVWGVLLIIAAAFLVLGALGWIIGFAVGRGRRRGWRSATGRWVRFSSGPTGAWQVEYEAHDGTRHRVMPVMNALSADRSATVPVSYDPGRPARAVIDTPHHRGVGMKIGGLCVMSLGALLALAGALILLAR